MATPIEILVKAKADVDAAFNTVKKQFESTSEAAKKYEKTQTSLTAKAGQFSDAIGKTTNTLARSADAFGLSANAMRTIGDVADVAQLGLENLNKSAVGFNAASLGVAGAGLAIGTAIGSWLREIPAVKEACDSAAVAIMRLFGVVNKGAQEAAAANANWAIEQKKVAAGYEALLRRQTAGMSAKEMQALLFPEPPKGIRERLVEEAKLREEKAKKAAEFALKEAKAFDEANRKAEADAKASHERLLRDEKAYVDAVIKESYRIEREIEKIAEAITNARVNAILEAARAEQEANESNIERARQSAEEMAAVFADARAHSFDGLADGLSQAVAILDAFGVSAESSLGKIANLTAGTANMLAAAAQRGFLTLADLAQQASQIFQSGSVLGGAASGAMTGFAVGGPLGAAIGGLAGGLLGLFGKGKQAREEMQRLRGELGTLIGPAKAAGIALDAALNAKNATQLKAAIAGIKSQLDLWAEGQDAIREAMDKYNISVSEMGPRFAQQELDKKVAEVVKAFEVLRLAGGDVSMIATKMGDDVLDLVNQYKAAGLEIPAALRPVLEAMLRNGQLVDENGEAYETLEEAGIHFAETMTEAMRDMMAHIEELIRVLARGFNVPVNFSYNTGGGSSPEPPGGAPPKGLPVFHTGGHTGFGASAFPAMLTPREFVRTEEQQMGLLAQAASMGAAMALAQMPSGGGGGDIYFDREKVGRTIAPTLSRMTRSGNLKIHPHGIQRGSGGF